jgi:hypothetical protein
MQLRQRFWIGLFFLTAIAVIVTAAQIALNPVRGSDAEIRTWLFTVTPLGSDQRKVQAALDERGWHQPGYQQTLPLPATKPFLGGEIGGYQGFPWYVFVSAFWEFDENDQLADIRIRRIIDCP